jgi:CRP-like cAMP-binding protein
LTVTEFLQSKVPFLAGLTEEQARGLAAGVEQRSYAKGQTVVFRGTTVDGLSIVASGKVGVWVKPKPSAQPALAAELGAGEVFGETSILESGTAGATVKAQEDETLVFLVPQSAFLELLASSPSLRARAESLLAERRSRNAALTAA